MVNNNAPGINPPIYDNTSPLSPVASSVLNSNKSPVSTVHSNKKWLIVLFCFLTICTAMIVLAFIIFKQNIINPIPDYLQIVIDHNFKPESKYLIKRGTFY